MLSLFETFWKGTIFFNATFIGKVSNQKSNKSILNIFSLLNVFCTPNWCEQLFWKTSCLQQFVYLLICFCNSAGTLLLDLSNYKAVYTKQAVPCLCCLYDSFAGNQMFQNSPSLNVLKENVLLIAAVKTLDMEFKKYFAITGKYLNVFLLIVAR